MSRVVGIRSLSDDRAAELGMGSLASAEVVDGGRFIRFLYQGGAAYTVPVAYLRTWFGDPHEVVAHQAAGHEETAERATDAKLEGTGGHCARVTLSDGSVFYLAWDLVLMACEPSYVHFGGWTEESKRSAEAWLRKAGPFRQDAVSP